MHSPLSLPLSLLVVVVARRALLRCCAVFGHQYHRTTVLSNGFSWQGMRPTREGLPLLQLGQASGLRQGRCGREGRAGMSGYFFLFPITRGKKKKNRWCRILIQCRRTAPEILLTRNMVLKLVLVAEKSHFPSQHCSPPRTSSAPPIFTVWRGLPGRFLCNYCEF